MALPRFFSRVADASLPLLSGLDQDALASHLNNVTVRLEASSGFVSEDELSDGYLLATNLLARLYPRLILEGPESLVDQARGLATGINPRIDLEGVATHTLAFSTEPPPTAGASVSATGWNVVIDGGHRGDTQAPAPASLLAAAAIGAGEIFRMVFADWIPRGRREPQPGSFNIVTLEPWSDVNVPEEFIVGTVHLAGAGAIGEAAIETLRASSVQGHLYAVDPEVVEVSNLQRYVLAADADEGIRKTSIIARCLEGSGMSVVEVPTHWGEDSRSAPGQDSVLVALDSGDDRIAVQASLPRRLYSAYTQPGDLGWSRHERFGVDPCLACLYWHRGRRPHRYEVIAGILGQHELRVRAYLATRVAVGLPLPKEEFQLPAVEDPPPPDEIERWMQTPILDDIAQTGGFELSEKARWESAMIGDLYRGICGGALIRRPSGADGQDVLVPLAHQSVLAGVMLAAQLLAASDDRLRAVRPRELEARYNALRRVPDSIAIPSSRASGCICYDDDFQASWQAATGGHVGES